MIGTTNENYKFTDIFDGNGHTITFNGGEESIVCDYTLYYGVFGYCDGATISNLTVNGTNSLSFESSFNIYMGGISGYASNTIINYCNSNINISGKSSSETYIGGLIGLLTNASTLSNCNNRGNIVSDAMGAHSYAGGIVGFENSSSFVRDCYNNGSVTTYNGNFSMAGGIVGYGEGDIKRVFNYGDITSNGNYTYAAGIIGQGNTINIKHCQNSGNIIGISNVGSVSSGGIVGQVYVSGNLSNAYNNGNVNSIMLGASGNYLASGGIIGEVRSGTTNIVNCFNVNNNFSISYLGECNNTYLGPIIAMNTDCNAQAQYCYQNFDSAEQYGEYVSNLYELVVIPSTYMQGGALEWDFEENDWYYGQVWVIDDMTNNSLPMLSNLQQTYPLTLTLSVMTDEPCVIYILQNDIMVKQLYLINTLDYSFELDAGIYNILIYVNGFSTIYVDNEQINNSKITIDFQQSTQLELEINKAHKNAGEIII